MSECPTCKPLRCCTENILAYDITGGSVYFNEQTSINFVCPPGFSCIPGVYTVPAGRIRLVVNTNGQPSTLRLQCCQSELVRDVPADATPEQIAAIAQDMVNACAVQQANCDGNATVNYSNTFRNQQQCYNGCANIGLNMGWTGSPPPLPPVFGYHQSVALHQSEICIRPSVFVSSVSQNDANQRALNFLTAYVIGLLFDGTLDCGYWNTEQVVICSDLSQIVVPPFSFFSGASQAAADAGAVAIGEAQCPGDCMAELAQVPYTGSGGWAVAQGRGGFSDKVYVAAGTGGLIRIDTATNTVDWAVTYGEDARGISIKSNGLITVVADTSYYYVSPVDGSVTSSYSYPGTCTLSYDQVTPYNDTDDFATVVCRGSIGPGNRDHIIRVGGDAPVVLYSSPSSFNSISAPGSYDPTRNQYNYKVLNSTTFPVGPERIVTFDSAFSILNSAVVAGIRNGDGLIYCSGPDSLYYWGRENVLGHGLYPVDPVSLVFGALILAGDSFPSGSLSYDPTTNTLAILEDGVVTFVDCSDNTISCSGAAPSSNNNGISFSSDPQKLFVKTDAGYISVRRTP